MNHYSHVKNESHLPLANKIAKDYGFFTFDRGWIGEWVPFSVIEIEPSKIEVRFMNKAELGGNFYDSICGNYFDIKLNMLAPNEENDNLFISNEKNFVRLINDILALNLNVEVSAELLRYGINPKFPIKKFYIIPANIVESNFPNDLDDLLLTSVTIETQRNITEIAELLVKAEKI